MAKSQSRDSRASPQDGDPAGAPSLARKAPHHRDFLSLSQPVSQPANSLGTPITRHHLHHYPLLSAHFPLSTVTAARTSNRGTLCTSSSPRAHIRHVLDVLVGLAVTRTSAASPVWWHPLRSPTGPLTELPP
jgi:hypothetical protein